MMIVVKFKLISLAGFLFIGLWAFPHDLFAQQDKQKEENENVFLHPKKFYKKFFPKLKVKPNPSDSLYIKYYPNYLSVSARALSPSIRLDVGPKTTDATGALKFRTNIGDILGFNVGYRFISAGFSFLLKSGIQTHDTYADSQYRTATIKYSSRAWSLQYKYLRFKGLTDVNDHPYVRRFDIVNKEYHFEGVYNPGWQKYSYTASFNSSQRQLKSRAGILLKTGVFYTQLSGDSALMAPNQEQYSDDLNDIGVIRTLSVKFAPGAGGTLIFFKRCYLSAVIFPSYDLLFYKYLVHPDEKVKGYQTFAFVLDGEASVGYQSKRFHAALRYEIERKSVSLRNIQSNTLYTYLGVEIGYRFNAPKFVKKVYKETMPPGM